MGLVCSLRAAKVVPHAGRRHAKRHRGAIREGVCIAPPDRTYGLRDSLHLHPLRRARRACPLLRRRAASTATKHAPELARMQFASMTALRRAVIEVSCVRQVRQQSMDYPERACMQLRYTYREGRCPTEALAYSGEGSTRAEAVFNHHAGSIRAERPFA